MRKNPIPMPLTLSQFAIDTPWLGVLIYSPLTGRTPCGYAGFVSSGREASRRLPATERFLTG